MQAGRYLTIQDYFKQAKVGGGKPLRRSSGALVRTDREAFARSLKAAQTAMRERAPGRTIQDYLKNPVRVPGLICNARHADYPGEHQSATAAQRTEATSDATSLATRGALTKRDPTRIDRRITAGVARAAAKYNVPSRLIHAVIRAESNYKVHAVSKAGAKGLMQLMPATARELGVRNPFSIEQNIDGGVKYLRNMLTRFNGDLKMALSAYNAGPGNVEKYNGQVPFAETRIYVAKVLRYAGHHQNGPVKPSPSIKPT